MHIRRMISIVVFVIFATLPVTCVRAQDLPGPYAIGHVSYTLADTAVYDRPVAVSIFYPVDPQTISPSTPLAQYQLDPWSNYLPVTTSLEWEPLGIPRAYEGPTPSNRGPFPLIIVAPCYTGDHWQYIYPGTSLASHGFVAAVTDHYNEGQWPWSSMDDYMVTLFNRTHDLPFAITELLQKNAAPQELLHGTMNLQAIAMFDHGRNSREFRDNTHRRVELALPTARSHRSARFL